MTQTLTIDAGTNHVEPVCLQLTNENVVIDAQEGSTAAVELTVAGEVSITVNVAPHASVTIRCLQTEEATVSQVSHLQAGATIHWQNISLAPVTHHLTSHGEGSGIRSDIDWIFYAKENEKQVIEAINYFLAEQGTGEITMRGVAEDTAHVTCNGSIAIGLNGSGTDAYLTEDVLMLDSTAKVDAVPGLEIKTNDVKASHSATVRKVTPEDLFYFASRGIDERTAKHMYVTGFLGSLTQQEAVASAIESKYLF